MIDARPAGRLGGILVLAFVLLFLLSPERSFARRDRRMPAPVKMPRVSQKSPQWRQRRIQQDTHRHPPNFFRNLRDLPPREQDRILQNDAQFHKLPPARQEQIRQNLRRWNSLSPQQKQVLRQREEIVRSLSPAQRQEVRNIFPQYRRLAPQQRQQVMGAFRRMRAMSPEQRQRFLASPHFRQHFTPQQRHVLHGLNQLLPQ